MDKLLQRGLEAKSESKHLEFKIEFDVSSKQSWAEIIKDVVAISNSGGGLMLFGVTDQGEATGYDIAPLIELDPATISDKIHKYTGVHFSGFSLSLQHKFGIPIACLEIEATKSPIVFSKPGTYDIGRGKQKTAFSQGTVYFRHGAKSEPGTYEDLREFIEIRISEERKQILNNFKKIISLPEDHEVLVAPIASSKVN